MRTLQIAPFAWVRVWRNERATRGFTTDRVLEQSAHPSGSEKSHELVVGVEALIPRGGMAEYGLIGLHFIPDDVARLRCEVPYSTVAREDAWQESLASTLDRVHLGLPEEYAPAVLSALSSAVERRLASGVVRVLDAAHGEIGSSVSVFRKLTRAAVELALLDDASLPDEQVVKLLRGLLA